MRSRKPAWGSLLNVYAAAAAVAASVTLVALTAPTPPASAWWATRVVATAAPLPAATLAPPADTECKTTGAVLGLLPYATISWTTVPEATSYVVTIARAGVPGTFVRDVGKVTSIELRGALLTDLVAGLGDLLSGSHYTLTVSAVRGAWMSTAQESQQVERAGLLGVLLGGVRCR